MKTTTNSAAATDFTALEMENTGNGDEGAQPAEAPVEEIPADDGSAEIPETVSEEISADDIPAEEVTEEESISSDMGSGMEDSMVEMIPDTSLPENEVLVPAGDE